MMDWKYVRKQLSALIADIQNHDERRDEGDYETAIQYCLNCLKNHMFPFTDSTLVLSELHGLVEKFSIRNEPGIGIALKDRVDNYLSMSNSFYRFDIVRLLFCLSNSPNASTFALTGLKPLGQATVVQPPMDDFAFQPADSEDEFLPSYSSTSSDESDAEEDRNLKALDFVEHQKAIADKMKACFKASVLTAEPEKEFTFAQCIGLLQPDTKMPIEKTPLCVELDGANAWQIVTHRIVLALSGISSDLFARQGDHFVVSGFHPDFNIPPRTFSLLLKPICDIASDSIVLDRFCTKFAMDNEQQCLQSAGVYIRKLQQVSRLELVNFLQSSSKANIFRLPQTVCTYLRHLPYIIPVVKRFNERERDLSKSESCALFLSELFKLIEVVSVQGDQERMRTLADVFQAAVTPYVQCLQLLLEQGYQSGLSQEQFMIECTMDTSGTRSFQLRGGSSIPIFLEVIAQPVLRCIKSRYQLRLVKVLESRSELDLRTIFEEKYNQSVQALAFCPFSVIIQESVISPLLKKVSLLDQAIVNEFVSSNRLRHYIQQIHDIYFMLKGHLFVDFIHELSAQRARGVMDAPRLSRLLHDNLYEYESDEFCKFILKIDSPKSFPELYFKFLFPLSLVFSDQNMTRYNHIFCFLLELSCAKSTLEALMKSTIATNEKLFLHVRWQIFHFINTLHGYIRSQISQLCNAEFFSKLEASSSIEELLATHDAFLDVLIRDLLLNDSTKVVVAHVRNILAMPNRLKVLCTNFEGDKEAVGFTLHKISSDFSSSNRFVMALLNRISLKSESRTQFGYVLMRLNYNSFYEKFLNI